MSNRTWYKAEALATSALYVALGSLSILALAMYKNGAAPLADLWVGRLRVYAWAGIFGAFAAGILLFAAHQWSKRDGKGAFWLSVALNLGVVAVCLGLTELGLRIVTTPGPYGPRLRTTDLLPHEWQKAVKINLDLAKKSRDGHFYFVEDETLGWTVGASRTSPDGLYKSSMEGIRSGEQGASFASSDPSRRVAIFGNSFTFAEEVRFEDSWGHFLEQGLPAGTTVLNFGVPGYGVDQAYLRFKREAPRWNPPVSVFAFVQDDIWRTGNVYPFVKGWLGPSKPRFILHGDNLVLLNSPTLPLNEIFARPVIFALPLLDYDNAFNPNEWAVGPLYSSFVIRLLVTLFPRWPEPEEMTRDTIIARLGSRIVEEFYATARASGTNPVIVYFPSRYDFRSTTNFARETVLALLKEKNVPVTDLTACLLKRVASERLFVMHGIHFSREGNAAAAACIRTLISDKLPA